jgi:hypothetical protein
MRGILAVGFFIFQNGFSKNEMGLLGVCDVVVMECIECGSVRVHVIKSETVCMSCYTVLDEGMYAGQMLV